ncbi:O-antigen ligase family protein [Algibacter miyuki]|uniref:O-antigen ligase family protein n=1 Tax=Algibacter miyuki TaxID=1306933 RepID=A0ABV5H1X3_9FLAO|nr:O-antigen ligase family protein [Algibacter miyuki]MDN3666509.1 O-antigen ligase family protein [Algibacter miyuki]
MKNTYIKILSLHVLFGVVVYYSRGFGNLYFFAILAFFFIKIINAPKKGKSVEIIKACAYLLGVEVVLRMSGGIIFYEAIKYVILLFAVLGLFYNGFNKKATMYFVYVLLLIPSVYLSLALLDVDDNIRKAIAFNLSGPVCLGVTALFCYGVKVTKSQLESIINHMVYPLVSTVVYIFLYNPNVADVATGTGSNFASSGGFGPNQVSTVLGLGMFLLTVRYFYFSKIKWLKYLDLILVVLFAFRAIVTFSRGGVFTALIMIVAFIFFQFRSMDKREKTKMAISVGVLLVVALGTWVLSSVQTNGFIDKRYANENAMGIEKDDVTTGRGDLFLLEFNEFMENPGLGVGVGRVKDIRFQKTGVHAASHNELSRIIAEHGFLGVLAFSILLLVPLFLRLKDRSNVLFFSFYFFWLLTVNHSAMRIAAPAFIYALSLLHVVNEKNPVHRKQVISKR